MTLLFQVTVAFRIPFCDLILRILCWDIKGDCILYQVGRICRIVLIRLWWPLILGSQNQIWKHCLYWCDFVDRFPLSVKKALFCFLHSRNLNSATCLPADHVEGAAVQVQPGSARAHLGLAFPHLLNFQEDSNVKSSDFLFLVNIVRIKQNTAVFACEH